MFVDQIAVFIENRKGRLLELTEVLAKNNIDLVTLSVADTNDFGILRAMTRDNKRAVEVLRAAGFTVSSNNLIGVEVPDEPGGLAKVLKCLDNNSIGIEYLYSFAHTNDNKAIILFRVENETKALEALKNAKIKVLEGSII